ncbi:hypothetical protein V7152_27110, partial [Neobacillus drentensis]|uniref:hypothetical protein n=1 Tax=Neobacillus drentensis TaxID=220684 RepID=UPI0030006854
MSKDVTKYFRDKVIQVDRGGPESRIGKLLHSSDDYIAVLTEDDGVVYYNTHHIKSFTENTKGQMEFDVEVPKDFKFKKAENFKQLLESLNYRWVKINRGGPETVEGVLCDVKKDFVYLIANVELVRIAMFHIKNVSYGVKIEKAESEEHKSRQKSNDKSENNNNSTNSSPKGTSQKSRQKSNDKSDNNNNSTNSSPKGTSQKSLQESNDESDNNNNFTNSSPKGTSQKSLQESNDESENNNNFTNSSPKETSQKSLQESNDESENNNNFTNSSPKGTSQKSLQTSIDVSENNNNFTNS